MLFKLKNTEYYGMFINAEKQEQFDVYIGHATFCHSTSSTNLNICSLQLGLRSPLLSS